MNDERTQTKQMTRRQEKAYRILDAAAELILRWGYNKTTVDDIARQAGVAKGTIYLYWKTREELFNALITREKLEVAEDIRQRMVADPAGVTLRGIYRHSALALMKRPVVMAALLGDINVLGKLASRAHATADYAEGLAGFNIYLEFLRERGLIRDDLSLQAQIYTVSAIIMGFFMVTPLMPEGIALSDEEKADLIGEAIHRTLETDRAVSSDEYQAISDTFMEYYDRLVTTGQNSFQREIEES